MVVGKEQSRNIPERNPQLINSLHRAPAGIDNELFVCNFYERTGSEAIQSRWWRSAPQKSNSKKIPRWFGHTFSLGTRINRHAKSNRYHALLSRHAVSTVFAYRVQPLISR